MRVMSVLETFLSHPRHSGPLPRRCYTHLIMAEGRSRIWIWFLVGGGLFALFVVAVFTLGFLSFGGQNEESFSGFGSKIAVVELDGIIFSPKQIVPQLRSLPTTIPSRPSSFM